MIDFRCSNLGIPQHYAYESYHRVHDCLMPQIELLRLIAAYTGTAPLCLMSEEPLSTHAKYLAPILGAGDAPPIAIRTCASCPASAQQWLVPRGSMTELPPYNLTVVDAFAGRGFGRPRSFGVERLLLNLSDCKAADPRETHGTDQPVQDLLPLISRPWLHLTSTPRFVDNPSHQGARASNLRVFHQLLLRRQQLDEPADELAHGKGAAATHHIVIVQRLSSRSFDGPPGVQLPWIASRLSAASGLTTRVYWGNESVAETLDLFANAAAVVGFHGAGLVNVLFTPHAACLFEVSGYIATNRSIEGRLVGRQGSPLDIRLWAHQKLRYDAMFLPIEQLLQPCTLHEQRRCGLLAYAEQAAVLGRVTTAARKIDVYLKYIPNVTLLPADVDEMSERVASCIREQRRGTQRRPAARRPEPPPRAAADEVAAANVSEAGTPIGLQALVNSTFQEDAFRREFSPLGSACSLSGSWGAAAGAAAAVEMGRWLCAGWLAPLVT